MVYSEENYKFELGVKGLTNLLCWLVASLHPPPSHHCVSQAACRLRYIVVALFQYGWKSCRNRLILTEHSVKVRPFLFSFAIVTWNLVDSEWVEVFFVRICRVFYGSRGQAQSLFFSMWKLRWIWTSIIERPGLGRGRVHVSIFPFL